MESVYRNAVVTISADAAPASSVGMASILSKNKICTSQIPSARCHRSEHNAAGNIYFGEDENWERGPLSESGWALQEEILSARILQFTKKNYILEMCRSQSKRDVSKCWSWW
jgi:hypothetical protein